MAVSRREFFALLGTAGMAALTSSRAAQVSAPHVLQAPNTPTPREATGWDPWLEISTDNLAWNVRQIQARVGKPVMAVVKANGYGHGLVGVAQTLARAGVKHFLVAKLDEARTLRQAGISGMILNFGPFSAADAEAIIQLRISQNVYTELVDALARVAARVNLSAHVHIKVDTGLGRVGAHHERALEFIEHVAGLKGIVLDGVFTTFTEDPEFDQVQLARFKEVCGRASARGINVGLRHAASSDAILNLPAAYEELDLVRPGIMLYGLYPSEKAEQERKLDLKPVLTLKARVTYVKTLAPGESVSYHRVFTASEPTRVATLPVGYSDGVPRALQGKGSVLIGGQRCPILAISANAVIARLGQAPAAPGDEAVLIGRQGSEEILTSEVARLAESSVYAVAMGMNPLLPAVYAEPTPESAPLRVRLSSLERWEPVHRIEPEYPPLAKEARIQGTVKVEAIIATDGTVRDLRVISGHPLLVQAAVNAVRQWRFQPLRLKGALVEVITLIEVPFRLPR